jgi:hypothetical protein
MWRSYVPHIFTNGEIFKHRPGSCADLFGLVSLGESLGDTLPQFNSLLNSSSASCQKSNLVADIHSLPTLDNSSPQFCSKFHYNPERSNRGRVGLSRLRFEYGAYRPA